MPYTTEQIQTVSRRLRSYDVLSSYAIRSAVYQLQRFERENQWEAELALRAVTRLECEGCGDVCGYVDQHGEVHYRYEDEHEHFDGMDFCTSECAYDAGYDYCMQCGDWHHVDGMLYIGDEGYFCDSSCAESYGFRRCERCDEWVSENRIEDVQTSNGWEGWCQSCAEDYARCCSHCGEQRDEDDMVCDDYGDWYCPDCAPDSTSLHSYGYTPSLEFFGGNPWSPTPPLFLGVELETDGGSDQYRYASELDAISEFPRHFWMTEDSSLNWGVEITSHPATLAYHVGMRDLYDEIGSTAARFGYQSHNGGRCGLHVHVNRRFFGKTEDARDLAGYKLLRLLQRFERPFTVFSRRTNDRWCSYRTSRDYRPNDAVKLVARSERDEYGPLQNAKEMVGFEKAHSQALNFEHRNTFEFRIFRGTLKWSTYFATLGLVDGLCRTVLRHGSTWVESVSWYDLIDEVVWRCSADYPRECLEAYLAEKGLR